MKTLPKIVILIFICAVLLIVIAFIAIVKSAKVDSISHSPEVMDTLESEADRRLKTR